MGWTQYSHREMHRLLVGRCLTPADERDDWIPGQALLCPYYVPLEGKLGADWGVIVNPDSKRFTLLTFEHDDCGCPDRIDQGDGPIHIDAPDQLGDMWSTDWTHTCDELCGEPCPWAK